MRSVAPAAVGAPKCTTSSTEAAGRRWLWSVPGRPATRRCSRTRPDRVRGDEAYSSRAIRRHCARGVTAVIAEPADQIGHRKRRGSRGGGPLAFGSADDRGRNVVERRFNLLEHWRGLATRYDQLAIVHRSAVVHAVTTWTKALSDAPYRNSCRTMVCSRPGPTPIAEIRACDSSSSRST